ELTDPLGLLHLVADHLPAPIAYVDRDLVYKFVNRTLCEWYNLPATHIVGKRAEDLLPQATIEKVRPHWDTALSGRIAQFEAAILYPDGYTRPVVINYVPQILADGSIPGFFVLSVDITLLKNAESRAAETSRLLQSVMDTVPHAIFVKDEEGRYTMVNRAFCEFHGLPPQDILGRTIHEFGEQTHFEKNALITLDEALWRTGTPAENPELTLTNHKGGEEIHNVFKLPLRNEQGELVGLVGLSEDITSRVRAERDLRKSEERTRAILSALPDMMFVVNREGLIEDFHTQDLQALFMPPEHFLGKPVHAVLPSPVGESIWRLLQEAMTQGSLKTLEYALPLPSGVCEYEARMVALNDSKAITLVRDITQQKQAGRALRDSEQRLTQILDAIPAALFLKDVQGRYRYVNRKFTELWGFTLAEVEGKTSDVLFPDQQWEAFIDLDEQVRMTGRIIEQELRVSTLDGAVRDMINTKFPLYDSENRLRGIGVIITDISKLRLTETQLRQAQKMEAIGQLAGGIAHDFNNLLQVILGYTLLLRARTDLPKESMDPLSAIQTASSRAAELTQQLLGYSRQQTLRRRVVDLNDLIAQQMRMVQRVIGESIELTFRPQARKAIVNVDSGAIEQVLLNLCLNARDAMPKGGSLILKTGTLLADARFCNANSWARSGEYVTITVQDTGVGIPKEHLERIFEPFFTTKEIGKGSGLGLSMTYGLLQQHDGYITAHSEHGVGATFVVYLPQSKEIPLVGLEAPVAPKPQGRGTLLVAEDDPRVLMLVQTILKQAGYEVLSVSNGEEAVSLLQRSGHSIDLALLDVVMPKLGGREVFKHIQTHHPGLPVVFSTGYSADMLDAEFLKQHEVTIIHKPYDPASLLQVVQKSIASRTTGSGPKPD
ncbi:MAG: PAS domain-containing protein, partial [Deltaproteobacteria bacterium]|nr:PAS domain-containing protein [Deltaproteobacteria bacterium]